MIFSPGSGLIKRPIRQYRKRGTTYAPEPVNDANSANIFTSVSVMNRIMLTLSIRGFSSAGAVQIEIKNHETGVVKEIVDADKLGTIWRASYAGFEAEDMRTAFDFTVLADGAAAYLAAQ